MDIRQLKYFIAVAEARNISRAAERLYVSQPPLTRLIKSLEDELGVTLFARTSWGVELTQAGESLLCHARDIMAHIELATEQARQVDNNLGGRIDIGAGEAAMLDFVPRILNDFAQLHPAVKVVLHCTPKDRQIKALEQGRIQIAFDHYFPASPTLHIERVCREPMLVALHHRHPFANQPFISLMNMQHETLIFEQDSSALSVIQALFRHHGLAPFIGHRTVDVISAVAMVAGGFGSALVAESVRHLQLPNVVYRPLVAQNSATIDLHCAYRKDDRSPALKTFLRIIHKCLDINRIMEMPTFATA